MLFYIVNIVRMSAGGLRKSSRLAKIEPEEYQVFPKISWISGLLIFKAILDLWLLAPWSI